MLGDKEAKELAIILGSIVRNSYLEDLHAGTSPSSACGDYSDVKVVSPYGEIPWNDVSRINNTEMEKFMKQIINRFYTALRYAEEPDVMTQLDYLRRLAHYFDEPVTDDRFRNIKTD